MARYDETLGAMKAGARRLWGARVIEAMAEQIDAAVPLIVLAGRNYRDPLWPQIERRASVPMEGLGIGQRSEEHTSELQSLMRSSYAVFCLKKKKYNRNTTLT